MITDELKGVIEEYQCSGCAHGSDTDCGKFIQNGIKKECSNHSPGTIMYPGGKIYLGMPKGFNKVGPYIENFSILIFDELDRFYDNLNIPVWKFRNDKGHVFIRGLSPRINCPFLHLIINCTDDEYGEIKCFELDDNFLEGID